MSSVARYSLEKRFSHARGGEQHVDEMYCLIKRWGRIPHYKLTIKAPVATASGLPDAVDELKCSSNIVY